MESRLIERMSEIQEQEQLSDRKFAAKLGLSNGQWSGVKARTKDMGPKTLRAIVRNYPELKDEVEAYWLAVLGKGNLVASA